MTPREPLLTLRGAARELSVSYDTLWRWIRKKRLPAVDLSHGEGANRCWRIRRSDLDAFERRESEPTEGVETRRPRSRRPRRRDIEKLV